MSEPTRFANGLYEQVVSNKLASFLETLDPDYIALENLDPEEAPAVLAQYAEKLIRYRLQSVLETSSNVQDQIAIVNRIVETAFLDPQERRDVQVGAGAEMLTAINVDPGLKVRKQTAREQKRPETSVAQSSLFTNAPREPNISGEIQKEIASSDEIDVMISFIRWSGVRLILDELKQFAERGKKLRVITTSYMGATELKAVEKLAALPNTEIKVSYDCARTRLHAKVYIFRRRSGYSTAYVGSSNLTAAAMTSGCEWNVKVTQNDLPDVFDKIAASYEGYWNAKEFEPYSKTVLEEALKAAKIGPGDRSIESGKRYFLDVKPYPYQQDVLDKLDAERTIRNSYRNLICAATGVGKTVIAALDYRRQCERAKRRLTLLFVAHRKEILDQSLECFREVMRDSEFGDVFYGGTTPDQLERVFVSINTLNNRDLTKLAKDKYDYIVFDECHHTAAKSYIQALEYFQPKFLLGLTATPERMDGEDILRFFDNKIAAEIRLPEAIDRKLLCPFNYFGVADTVDLSGLRWTKRGYDTQELENAYVGNTETADKRVRLILNSLDKYVGSLAGVKGLVFCVSTAHAKYMAARFNDAGIPTLCLTSESGAEERDQARAKLETGAVNFICVVDLYNEGVDIKQIDTILFLRPTESLTIFLQQFGRGLRLAEGKDGLTVLDFIGQANKKYDKFEDKFGALTSISVRRLSCKREITADFPHAPRGCFIKLEQKAKDYVLNNIRKALGVKKGLIEQILEFREYSDRPFSTLEFLNEQRLTPQAIYTYKISATAILRPNDVLLCDSDMPKKLFRLAALDSIRLLDYLIDRFDLVYRLGEAELSAEELAFWQIVYATFIDEKPRGESDVRSHLEEYWTRNRIFAAEALDVMRYKRQQIDFIARPLQLPYACVLNAHCTYTRAQALAALDYWNTSSEGVTRVAEKKTTCLFVTLNKSSSFYSPATAYHDYSINEELFHWQSQNATASNTNVGQRYIRQRELGENILLFVREQKTDNLGPVPFTLLGLADFVKFEGEKPMNITWRLRETIPAKFLQITDKLGIDY